MRGRYPIPGISVLNAKTFLGYDALSASLGNVAAQHDGFDPSEEAEVQTQFMIYRAPAVARWVLQGGIGVLNSDRADYDRALDFLRRTSPPPPNSGCPDEPAKFAEALESKLQRGLFAEQPNGCRHKLVILALAKTLCQVKRMTGDEAFAEIDRLTAEWPAWEQDVTQWWAPQQR
jgi:hypothetical protein